MENCEGAKTKDANLAIPTIALRLKLILASDATERQTKKKNLIKQKMVFSENQILHVQGLAGFT